jgi:beta-lactamase class A
LSAVEQGKASLDQEIGGYSARSLLKQMIQQSDNVSWRTLKRWLGYEHLEDYAHQIGLFSFDSYDNTITASDEASLLQKLYQGQLLNQNDTGLLLSFMQNTNNEDLIPAALPQDAAVYHKYGLLNNNLHDMAIIKFNNSTFTLVIFTNSEDSMNYERREAIIHEITQAALASL